MIQFVIDLLVIIGAAGLTVQAFIGLGFFISCVGEKEPRASLLALLQFLGMTALLLIYLILAWMGFFKTGVGLFLLAAGYALALFAAVLMLTRIGKNPRALLGTRGLLVGEAKRFDEKGSCLCQKPGFEPGIGAVPRLLRRPP